MDLRYKKIKVNSIEDIPIIAEKLKSLGYKWKYPLIQKDEDLTKVQWIYITYYKVFHYKIGTHRRKYYTEINFNEL